ncbi:hypothetical protein LR48_Vigan10g166300 [Vigna angularis]|uniref:Uncharacterized protein n=1 Tax=Phaseolus angularis TaxID=3914 RepID=A0A0L9VL29_PHAAN|nr:hypothetical protein LR48_Vigan10g166300 [Vigna angularis]
MHKFNIGVNFTSSYSTAKKRYVVARPKRVQSRLIRNIDRYEMARLVSLSGLELEGARIALLSQFSYSQLSSAATKLQAITLFRALASNPDIRSIDICRSGKKVVWSRNPITEGFR